MIHDTTDWDKCSACFSAANIQVPTSSSSIFYLLLNPSSISLFQQIKVKRMRFNFSIDQYSVKIVFSSPHQAQITHSELGYCYHVSAIINVYNPNELQ